MDLARVMSENLRTESVQASDSGGVHTRTNGTGCAEWKAASGAPIAKAAKSRAADSTDRRTLL